MTSSQFQAWVRAYVGTQLNRMFGFTLVSNATALGDSDEVGTADDDKGQRPARRIEPWGHRGRPPGKVRGLTLRLGSSNVIFLGVASTDAYGPDDLDVGETALYCTADGALVKLNKDGDVQLKPSVGKATTIGDASLITPQQVLVKNSFDSMGVPVTQAPTHTTSKVKSGI